MTEGEPLPGARGKIYFPFVCPDQYEHTNEVIAKLLFQANFWNQQYQIS